MPPLRLEGEVVLRSDIDTAWSIVADTDRQNRLIGLGPLQVTAADAQAGAARFLVRSNLSGLAVEWEDLPTELVRGQWMHVRRRFRSGPLRSLEVEARLSSEGTGTRLHMALTLEPRIALLRPVARIQGRRSLDAMLDMAVQVDRAWSAGMKDVDGARRRGHRISAEALARGRAALKRSLPEGLRALGNRLCDFLAEASDAELVRMRPFELAHAWGVPKDALLHVCLVAVVEGLLELSWEAVCPSCRGPSARMPALAEVSGHAECTLCDLRFEVTLDESLEATFTPAPAVRRVEAGPFCISGPARLPHVVSQRLLPKDAAVTFSAPAEPGRYRLFVRGGETLPLRVEEGGAERAVFPRGAALAQVKVRPGAVLEVLPRGEETHVKLEHLEWASRAASAHHLALTPAFRRLFAREALRPGVALAVKRVALLFSDLTGSTALYTRVGDAVAFGLVQSHFELLAGVVERHGGTVVKTIGDAVMAAFGDELDAVRAALEMQSAFAAFTAAAEGGGGELPSDALKIGGYAGPCFAVSANGTLDYFGQSVNIAARLQGEARPGEIVLPVALVDQARASGVFESLPGGPPKEGERFVAALKGLDVQLPAVRLTR